LRYSEALQIREELNATVKQDASIRRDLAEVWMRLGRVLEKKGDISQALENYHKAAETLESLSMAIPADAVIREMLAEARFKESHF
jgi:tetratricopeptide (TPR) repeat protein